MRLDVARFTRHMSNFADDDLLLNTGVSFPTAFRKAEISGTEIKLDLPHWSALSGFVSYANARGVGYLPITGGLLLGDDASTLLASTDRFPITQDQRNTVRGRATYQVLPRAWVALVASYGSGLPVEFVGDREQAIAQYGQRIVDRVDLERGRVHPSMSFDASTGVVVARTKKYSLRVQAGALNLTDRLNVIDFAGLFSGTALAPPRSFALRLQAEFSSPAAWKYFFGSSRLFFVASRLRACIHTVSWLLSRLHPLQQGHKQGRVAGGADVRPGAGSRRARRGRLGRGRCHPARSRGRLVRSGRRLHPLGRQGRPKDLRIQLAGDQGVDPAGARPQTGCERGDR